MDTHSEDEFARAATSGAAAAHESLRQFWWVAIGSLPAARIDPALFGAFVGQRIVGNDPDGALERLRPDDLLVAFAAMHDDGAAMMAFEDECIAPLSRSLARLGFTDIPEIQQRTRTHLLIGTGADGPALAKYGGRGRLRNWVRITAIRIGRRAQPRALDGGEPDRLLVQFAAEGHDTELEYFKQLYRDEFAEAFEAGVATLTRDERNLLRAQTIDGLSLDRVATLFGVSRATAARRLAKARIKLANTTKEQLAARLGLAPDADEVRSILRLLRSRTELSLARLL